MYRKLNCVDRKICDFDWNCFFLQDAVNTEVRLITFHGRPHQGPAYERIKLTRARFKYAQKSVENNQDTLRAESLASKLETGDVKTFWKEIKLINTGSTPLKANKNIAGM